MPAQITPLGYYEATKDRGEEDEVTSCFFAEAGGLFIADVLKTCCSLRRSGLYLVASNDAPGNFGDTLRTVHWLPALLQVRRGEAEGVTRSGAMLCSGWSNGTKPTFLGGLVPFNQL